MQNAHEVRAWPSGDLTAGRLLSFAAFWVLNQPRIPNIPSPHSPGAGVKALPHVLLMHRRCALLGC